MKKFLVLFLFLLLFGCGDISGKCSTVKETDRAKICIEGHTYIVETYHTYSFYFVKTYIPIFDEDGKPKKCNKEN
jgi:hypothetical protein